MSDVRCPHGDPTCPCNDGDGTPCNYEYDPHTRTAGAPCHNPECVTCRPRPAA